MKPTIIFVLFFIAWVFQLLLVLKTRTEMDELANKIKVLQKNKGKKFHGVRLSSLKEALSKSK